MTSHIRARVRRDEGFTLVELLVVIIILAILLAIAIPSYIKFRDRADSTAAAANVRAGAPAMEAWNADNTATGYTGATLTALQASYDSAIKNFTVVSATQTTYCIKSTVGQATFYKAGPSSDITTTVCT